MIENSLTTESIPKDLLSIFKKVIKNLDRTPIQRDKLYNTIKEY
tara:strand:- start:314 stop:445 length:132 start_codon:yes stop_codon:yes gene_type:complete